MRRPKPRRQRSDPMAQDNQEIEIKIPVDKETFQKVRQLLLEKGVQPRSNQHVDTYFTPSHRDFLKPQFPFEWLSVRRRGDRALLCYKHWYPENQEIATHCDEFETIIKDPEKLEKVLEVLNFKELVTVDKKREAFVVDNEFKVCMDEVKDLGYFIEIESESHAASVEETRNRLFEFAASIGINDPKMDKRGYPYELMKKKGLL